MSNLAKRYIDEFKTFELIYKNAQTNLVVNPYVRVSNQELERFWSDIHKHFQS